MFDRGVSDLRGQERRRQGGGKRGGKRGVSE